MGTRGFLAFVAGGETKVGYNHCDSYPSHLGRKTLEWLTGADLDEAYDAARRLRVVSPDGKPSAEEIESLGSYANLGVGGQSDHVTWYQLLRETQGDAAAILHAGAIEDASSFPAESLFAEWGYVIDFDSGQFEVYLGFQKAAHEKGRFASMPPSDGYYPVALVASWPLKELPSYEDFIAAVDPEDAD